VKYRRTAKGGIHSYIPYLLNTNTANRSINSSPTSHRSDRITDARRVWEPLGFEEEVRGRIIQKVRFDHQSTGWGLSQYGKMAWSLFLLVNSYQTVDCFITISSRRVMLESSETMLTAAVRYFQPFRCQRS
jgi:hypothetical protein